MPVITGESGGVRATPDTIVETIRNDTSNATAINQSLNMEGATKLVLIEKVDAVEDLPTYVGPDWSANIRDGDFSTLFTESLTATKTAVLDWGSVAIRDLYIDTNSNAGPSVTLTLTIAVSDDDIQYTTVYTVSSSNNVAFDVDQHIFHGSFRYARARITGSTGQGLTCTINELYATGASNLVLKIKSDAETGTPDVNALTLPIFSGRDAGNPVSRIVEIGPSLVDDISNPNHIYLQAVLPSKTDQLKITEDTNTSRIHSITALKVFTGA